MGLLDHRQTANAGTDIAADAAGHVFAQGVAGGQATVSHGLTGCRQTEMNEAVHMARFFLRYVIGNIETPDLTRDAAGERACIKRSDRANTRLARQQIGPVVRHRVSHGADTAQAGYDNAAPTHHAF